MEQQLSLLAESWSSPAQGSCSRLSVELTPNSPHWPFTGSAHRRADTPRRGREYRLIQAILHHVYIQRSTGTHHLPLKSIQRQRSYSKHGEDLQTKYGTAHRITQVNKTFGRKYRYRNANWIKTSSLFMSLILLLFFRVTVSKHKLVHCENKLQIIQCHTVLNLSTKHWYSIEVWGLPLPLTHNSITQEVSQGN